MRKVPFSILENYLPESSFNFIEKYLNQYSVKLKLKSERKTLLGTYHYDIKTKSHVITLNETLNKYSMLITLLHEIAHLLVFIEIKNLQNPHGPLWQNTFKDLLREAIALSFFPSDIEVAILNMINKSHLKRTNEEELTVALHQHDSNVKNYLYIKDIKPNSEFSLKDGRAFRMLGKKVKRYYAKELSTNQMYCFNATYPVKSIT